MENCERLLRQACGQVRPFALGWSERNVCLRICDIWRFALFNSERVISLARRRRIARLADNLREASGRLDGAFAEVLGNLADAGRQPARDLRKELNGLGGLGGEFLDTLRELAGGSVFPTSRGSPRPPWRAALKAGGDRRSGDRSLKGSVLGMAVRLYYEAHANPGFSVGGPLVRFANAIGEFALGENEPFTVDSVRAEYRRFKRNMNRRELILRRIPSLQFLYSNEAAHPD
jgi:hypothetical protein